MTKPLNILLKEDSPEDARLIARELDRAQLNYQMKCVSLRPELLKELDTCKPDVILSNYALTGYDALTTLSDARSKSPATPFVFVSSILGEDKAIESLKMGASDYVVKGSLMRLPSAIQRAITEKRLRSERESIEHRLRASEAMFKSLAEQAPVGIMLTNAEGKVIFCNEQWGEIAGRSTEEVVTGNLADFFHPDDKDRVLHEMQDMFQNRNSHDINYRLVRPSGEIRWVTSRGTSQVGENNKLIGFIGLLIDSTEQKLAEQKIARLNRIQEVLSSINSTIVRVSDREKLLKDVCQIAIRKGNFRFAWVALIDPDSGELRATKALGTDRKLLGRVRSETVRNLADVSIHAVTAIQTMQPVVIDRIAPSYFDAHWAETLRNAGIESAVYLPLVLGENVFGILSLLADTADFFTASEMLLLNELAKDIAFALDHLEKEERVNYLAYYDSLTDLPNRTLFLDHLNQRSEAARADGQQLAVVVFDIDKFRHINESFGERSGDSILRAVAQRLKTTAADSTSLGRIGGDVFGALIPHVTDAKSLMQLFEMQLRDWANESFLLEQQEISLTFRAGIALFPDDGADAETLLQNANAALKQAKLSSQLLLFYSRAINERVSERLQLENRLRRAIEQEQFVLHYQPKINLVSGRTENVEALIRWNDPEHGLIPPGAFIPLLEESGMIYDVGLWALCRARDDYARLRREIGSSPRIAVNVSAVQLQRQTFVDELIAVVESAPDNDHGLDIEITESLIMNNIEDNIRKLKQVRGQDVRIAVDDFGTGYSSLSYIAKLPIDILKIDRSFIAHMSDSAEDLSIVSTIIALAHSLGLKVVAEGVETEDQARQLRKMKCDEAQGYLYCSPVPVDQLVNYLAMQNQNRQLRIIAA